MLDYRIFRQVNNFVGHHSWLGRALAEVTDIWGLVVLLAAAAALWVVPRRVRAEQRRLAVVTGVTAAGVAFLASRLVIQNVWHRSAPCVDHLGVRLWEECDKAGSFPSDHASFAFGLAAGIFFIHRWLGLAFAVAAAVIAFGRIAIGVHYPSDVGAGVILGVAVAAATARLLARSRSER